MFVVIKIWSLVILSLLKVVFLVVFLDKVNLFIFPNLGFIISKRGYSKQEFQIQEGVIGLRLTPKFAEVVSFDANSNK